MSADAAANAVTAAECMQSRGSRLCLIDIQLCTAASMSNCAPCTTQHCTKAKAVSDNPRLEDFCSLVTADMQMHSHVYCQARYHWCSRPPLTRRAPNPYPKKAVGGCNTAATLLSRASSRSSSFSARATRFSWETQEVTLRRPSMKHPISHVCP